MSAAVREFVPGGPTALVLILLFSLSLNVHGGQYNEVISIGDPMPSFTDLPTVSGEKLSSSDLLDDIVVLVSMSNNCPFSQGIEHDLIAFVDSVQGQSVKVIAMGFNLHKGDLMPAMREHADAKGFNFTYLRDDSQKLGRQLGTAVTPEFFVFNKERKLVYMGLMHDSPPMAQGEKVVYPKGKPTEFYVADAVKQTQKNQPVTLAETSPFGCTIEYIVDRYEK
jgi:peroxiredoxin